MIPAGFDGQLEVCFVSPWYWHVAELISVFAVLGLGIGVFLQRRKEMSGHEAKE